ncbi:streptomycin 3'-adenylyltransferase [Mycoplana sp. BE70]|uniref:aminoglycoside adenylyltransferase family protein n=1 Tax=Mycoplana sp. BE70 TaxID=2817775 RepID=UPI00285D9439|nr:aminoglycoside adenylyltransferase family protein [Mycoplana sp. BE70]MDR6759325.1 streptomycin 3'-adenylyltransferase [Mycoplana sp. BE70]
MQANASEQTDQMRTVTDTLRRVLGNTLLAVYLHGSAVAGGLRPQSDIDLLAVIDRSMTDHQRSALLAALLQVSGRHPAAVGGPRCIEVMVFVQSDLSANSYPARSDFTYGEWLRDAFEAGETPMPTRDPEYTLVLAQARSQAISLFGGRPAEHLPEIPPERVRQAMHEALPALFCGLQGDERNVLLTLARMWHTAKTAEFVAKDAAAAWAVPQIPDQDAATLDYARRAYLGEVVDEWDVRLGDARRLAELLHTRVTEASTCDAIEETLLSESNPEQRSP